MVYLSAKKNINMDRLMDMIQKALDKDSYRVKLLLPYDQGNIFSSLSDKYVIEAFEYLDTGISVTLSLDEIDYNKYKKYIEIQ